MSLERRLLRDRHGRKYLGDFIDRYLSNDYPENGELVRRYRNFYEMPYPSHLSLNRDEILQKIIDFVGEEAIVHRRNIQAIRDEIRLCINKIDKFKIDILKEVTIRSKKLPSIMSDLIEIATKDDEIKNLGFCINNDSNEILFNIMFEKLDFNKFQFASQIEMELTDKYEDLNFSINPIDIEEEISGNLTVFYTKD